MIKDIFRSDDTMIHAVLLYLHHHTVRASVVVIMHNILSGGIIDACSGILHLLQFFYNNT